MSNDNRRVNTSSSPVRVAILADDRPSFVKPMAEGLARMVSAAGGEPVIFYEGLSVLEEFEPPSRTDVIGVAKRRFKYVLWPLLRQPWFPSLARRLRRFDVVVVVSTIPRAFLRSFFWDDMVRMLLANVPIVLYDVFYLPTRGAWAEWLRRGNPEMGIPEGNQWGLDRYDWYLCASVVSECPLPPGPHPYSLVGLNLDDGSLRPEQGGEFIALLDFEHPDDVFERSIQVSALERTGTPYIVLNGRYPIEHIRAIYRRTAIFFVAMRESFGLPICELQACGSYIFTPYARWCPSHWKKPRLAEPGEGRLSSNFIVYDNDADKLAREIVRIRGIYDAQRVRRTFLEEDPQYFWGCSAEVSQFLEMVRSGAIHPTLHHSHRAVPLPTLADPPDPPQPRHHRA
jgi:hypothetical protein